MLALVVRFQIKDPASAALFDDLTQEAVAAITSREPGTLVYATHTVPEDPLARVFYEVYEDDSAFQAHEDAEHVRSFHARKNPLLAVEPHVTFLTPKGSRGLPGA